MGTVAECLPDQPSRYVAYILRAERAQLALRTILRSALIRHFLLDRMRWTILLQVFPYCYSPSQNDGDFCYSPFMGDGIAFPVAAGKLSTGMAVALIHGAV